MYGFYWFMLAAEFVTLAGLAALTATGLLAASALSWLSWFAVMALLFIQGSDTFLAVSRLGLVCANPAWEAALWTRLQCMRSGVCTQR